MISKVLKLFGKVTVLSASMLTLSPVIEKFSYTKCNKNHVGKTAHASTGRLNRYPPMATIYGIVEAIECVGFTEIGSPKTSTYRSVTLQTVQHL